MDSIEWPKQGRKKVNENEIDALAKELANAVEDKLEDKKGKVFLIQDSYCERVLVILGSAKEINFYKTGLDINTDFNSVIKACILSVSFIFKL